MSEYEITRGLVSWKGTQSTNYFITGSQLVNVKYQVSLSTKQNFSAFQTFIKI